jgi:hypothetical protein
MAAGDVKKVHVASSNLSVTSLDGLAASATHVAGWESPLVDHSSDKVLDDSIRVKVTVESAGLSAGQIRVYLVGMLDDSTWPDVFDGTQSVETVTSVDIRDAICLLGAVTVTDTTASRVYYLHVPSVAAVFNGNMPEKYVIFITQSTGTTLETSGNQVTLKSSYENVAAS